MINLFVHAAMLTSTPILLAAIGGFVNRMGGPGAEDRNAVEEGNVEARQHHDTGRIWRSARSSAS